ncbi:CbtA family protein [Nitrososphaera sp.]|uniref:CbtA family protein n=1 Tax=Nitrososphaera sp. TaxID=1971748 RepID=UPI00307E653D
MAVTTQKKQAVALSAGAGLLAGVVLAAMNLFVVGPYVEQMADVYFDVLASEGELGDEEFEAALKSLYAWQMAFPVAMGLAAGALVGVIYLRIASAGDIGRRKGAFKIALAVAVAAWVALYVMPALKYPYPPGVLFDPEAAGAYMALFSGYAALSGAAALGSAIAFSRMGKRSNWYFGAAGAYLAVMAAMFFAFPDYQQQQSDIIPLPLLNAWRSASAAVMTAFWFTLGIATGALLEWREKKNVSG